MELVTFVTLNITKKEENIASDIIVTIVVSKQHCTRKTVNRPTFFSTNKLALRLKS